MENVSFFLEHFKVDTARLWDLIHHALSRGGDFADLFFEHTVYYHLGLRDKEVNRSSAYVDYGMGVRVIKGEQTGYAYTQDTSLPSMRKAALTASCIADGPERRQAAAVHVQENPGDFYPIRKDWSACALNDKIVYLRQMTRDVFDADSRVKKVMAGLSHSHTLILYFNSQGLLCTDTRPLASLSLSCLMQEGSRSETADASRSYRMGAEFLDLPLARELSQEVIRNGSLMFLASQPKGGNMPVVMGSGASGIFLHEAIGHSFEADFNRKNLSIFAHKMGRKICHESINVADDGTLPGNRGAVNVDDEGVAGRKTYMVREGVLHSFLHDRMSAKHYGVEPTGNGRRESFRYMPLPRMRATCMENGPATEEQLIASVKKGLYVDSFSNGQVQIGSGDFTFYVKTGYRIENGRLTRPVKDSNIIGNGPTALAAICGVADNGKVDDSAWICGKGQSCPVSCGMPSVLINELTVGGHN